MKKNIGNALALYPTPLVVIGAMVDGKPNWLIAGHVGIIGHDHVMVSLAKPHYTNKGIRETKKLSINIVTEDFLPLADRAGCVSGAKEDKSGLLEYTVTEAGVPTVAVALRGPYDLAGLPESVWTLAAFEYTEQSIRAVARVLRGEAEPTGRLPVTL
mgnify:CR=1 FL=1